MYEEIRKYEKLKSKIEDIVYYLNICIEKLESPSTLLKNYYSFDSKSIDNEGLKGVRSDFIYRRNYLNNTVLPEIRRTVEKLYESGGE